MKLKNQLFTGLICLSAIAITACGGKDDNDPSPPANTGSFTGQFTNAAGEVSQWTATSAKAVLDTSIFGDLTITATSASGDVIEIVLNNGEETAHLMNSNTYNYSTYSADSLTTPATTETDDGVTANLGNITISDNGDSDDLLKCSGSDNFAKWFIVNPNDDDDLYGKMENISFSAPLTRVGFTGGGGSGESSLIVDIDGATFNPDYVSASSFGGAILLIGTNNSGKTVSVNIPSGATVGNHDLSNTSSQYSINYSLGQTSFISSTGSVNISQYDQTAGTVTGTFSCTVIDILNPTGATHSLTNGSFSVE